MQVYWLVLLINLKALRAYPLKCVLLLLLVLLGLGLEVLNLLNDPERLEDVGDIIKPPGLRLKEQIVFFRILLAVTFFLAVSQKLDNFFDGQSPCLLEEELDKHQAQHSEGLVLLGLYRDESVFTVVAAILDQFLSIEERRIWNFGFIGSLDILDHMFDRKSSFYLVLIFFEAADHFEGL